MPGGLLIAFEGGEATGKTTQTAAAAQWLKGLGFGVLRTREPGDGRAGEKIRELLLGPGSDDLDERAEALLYAADRAQHVARVIMPAMLQGTIMVCDRYADSSVAYQGAGRGLGAERIRKLGEWASRGVAPDLTVLLDMSHAVARERRSGPRDRIEQQPPDFHQRVREAFLELSDDNPRRYLVLPADQPADHVTFAVRERLLRLLARRLGTTPEGVAKMAATGHE